jgi:F-type H+-transporting ATPase subunit beta
MVMLSRDLAAEGIYPAIDPLARLPPCSTRWSSGRSMSKTATAVRQADGALRELRDMIALLGVEELGAATEQLLVGRARRLQRFLTQPFFVTAAFTGMEGRSVPAEDTIAGCRAILSVANATTGKKARST